MKFVDQLGMCIEAKRAFPECLVVFRRCVDNDGYWIHEPDPKLSARRFLDIYSANIDTHARNTGMSVAQILACVDVLEPPNEVIGTFTPDTELAVAFDCAFADAVRERYGKMVNAALLTIPVGNPDASEIYKLLPAARKAYTDGHYLAPHPYWPSNRDDILRNPAWLEERWLHFAARWQTWDDLFRANGVYPRYYGGESGICYSPDGWNFNSGRGWKSCGSFLQYIEQIKRARVGYQRWNALHGNRFTGSVLFCYGSDGWDDFKWTPGDLADLTKAMA